MKLTKADRKIISHIAKHLPVMYFKDQRDSILLRGDQLIDRDILNLKNGNEAIC